MRAAPFQVAIVEDRPVIRAGLARLIDNAAGFRCTDCFASMEETLAAVERDPPDLLLADLGLPGMPGTEGIRRLSRTNPDLPVLVLSVHDDDERIFDAVMAGACGNVLKTAAPRVIVATLRLVAEGGAPMTAEVARRLLERRRHGKLPRLDEEDLGILERLAQGHIFATAAAELGLAPLAVAQRVRRIYDRLRRVGRAEQPGESFAGIGAARIEKPCGMG